MLRRLFLQAVSGAAAMLFGKQRRASQRWKIVSREAARACGVNIEILLFEADGYTYCAAICKAPYESYVVDGEPSPVAVSSEFSSEDDLTTKIHYANRRCLEAFCEHYGYNHEVWFNDLKSQGVLC